MAATVDIGFMWTVGGLMAVAVWLNRILCRKPTTCIPILSVSLNDVDRFGGVTSTVAKLMGDFTEKALLDSGSEDVVMTDGGFSLTAAVLFYFGSIGVILCSSTSFEHRLVVSKSTHRLHGSDISRYSVQRGETSIRKLLQRGVGVDTISWLVQMSKMKVA